MDRFNNLFVTAFVTPGGARFLLLHDGRGDDACRAFFAEVYELYLRVSAWERARSPRVCPLVQPRRSAAPRCSGWPQVMLNPFHTPSTKITSKAFDAKVRMLGKRILG